MENESQGWGEETGGGDSSKTGSWTEEEEKKSTNGVGASFTPEVRDKVEKNNI